MRTLDIKTITDKSCSIGIAQFGLSRKLEEWQPSNKVYKELQQLSREKNQVISERVVCMNQLHAEKAEALPNTKTIKRLKTRISLLEKQEKEINADMLKEVENSNEATEGMNFLSSIPAVKLNQEHRELFHRIVNKTGIKMKGLVAVQRKLLELMYIL